MNLHIRQVRNGFIIVEEGPRIEGGKQERIYRTFDDAVWYMKNFFGVPFEAPEELETRKRANMALAKSSESSASEGFQWVEPQSEHDPADAIDPVRPA